ncbi:terpenoid synthase [Phanerochaete sordida]|uniref:Terpenoid synthase n=1 Tax=Phanerochaete sordida TaxID=48140 RepID=A0A9P3FXD9_9APHY|nr:terpenoid synthase [Phanerochaete sordida]
MLYDLAARIQQARSQDMFTQGALGSDSASNGRQTEIEEICRDALHRFIERIQIAPARIEADPTGTIARSLAATVNSWGCVDLSTPAYQKRFAAAVGITTLVFRHTRLETQAYIAVYAFLAICLDDLAVPEDALVAFAPRLLAGAPQGHWVLARFVAHLGAAPRLFAPFSVAAMVSCTVQFVNSTLLDRMGAVRLTPGSLPYVHYKRAINGVGEAFALFAWEAERFPDSSRYLQILPDLCRFMEYANDILSFYKEELAGEQDNFVHDIMAVSGLDAPQVLSDLVDAAVKTVQRARIVLQDSEELKVFESMLEGYIAFHFTVSRYRLREIYSMPPSPK